MFRIVYVMFLLHQNLFHFCFSNCPLVISYTVFKSVSLCSVSTWCYFLFDFVNILSLVFPSHSVHCWVTLSSCWPISVSYLCFCLDWNYNKWFVMLLTFSVGVCIWVFNLWLLNWLLNKVRNTANVVRTSVLFFPAETQQGHLCHNIV